MMKYEFFTMLKTIKVEWGIRPVILQFHRIWTNFSIFKYCVANYRSFVSQKNKNKKIETSVINFARGYNYQTCPSRSLQILTKMVNDHLFHLKTEIWNETFHMYTSPSGTGRRSSSALSVPSIRKNFKNLNFLNFFEYFKIFKTQKIILYIQICKF